MPEMMRGGERAVHVGTLGERPRERTEATSSRTSTLRLRSTC